MGRVIAGAVLGAILGGMIGGNVKYNDAGIQLSMPSPQGGMFTQTISLTNIMHYLSLIAGVGSGAIVGAIAGATSASPHSRPLGLWFWVIVAVLLVVLFFLGAAYWFIMPWSPAEPHKQIPVPQPANQQGSTRITTYEHASRSFTPRFANRAVT